MLIAALIVIIILLILLLASMTGVALKNGNSATMWMQRCAKASQDYIALEQGRDEESDSYEQQFLTFNEMIENQSTAIDSYIEDLHFMVGIVRTHMDDCLPVVAGDQEQRERFLKIEQGINLQVDG